MKKLKVIFAANISVLLFLVAVEAKTTHADARAIAEVTRWVGRSNLMSLDPIKPILRNIFTAPK